MEGEIAVMNRSEDNAVDRARLQVVLG